MMTADADADPNDKADSKNDGTKDINNDDSDLTNRFKYKVNALMGSYDPVQGDTDTENTDGNILSALLQFPSLYTFNIVGRTGGGDNGDDGSVKDAYVRSVRSIVADGCGAAGGGDDGSDDGEKDPTGTGVAVVPYDAAAEEAAGDGAGKVVCVVKPRGKNFTKITVEVMVESAAVISSVYEELGALERTVMRF